MDVKQVMKELGFLSWLAIFIGFQRGWMNSQEVIAFASDQYFSGKGSENDTLEELVSARYVKENEIKVALLMLADSDLDEETVLERWRLACLLSLSHAELSDEEKIARLQEVYADFDYPEDMRFCSIYSLGTKDPLIVMSEVVQKLEKELIGAG
ncbi:DUF2247 family protein [Pseudomonas sp. GM25]|uniref:DUF2247 family protein n=1 Tax=Pseudomonas sp. GM25 TaxID=1144327 RepID=UPI00027046C0|nr:DUF2247 family protein [Pseudomonas sp. GM25]EJM32571.1 hypothetical protein PMI24_00073 [Pseudomonas sp. GM25]